MPTAEEMFAHIHRDGIRELELARAEGLADADPTPVPLPPVMSHLRDQFRKLLDEAISKR